MSRIDVDSISQRLGGNTAVEYRASNRPRMESQTSTAINAALPILLGALDRNTDQPGGADGSLRRTLPRP